MCGEQGKKNPAKPIPPSRDDLCTICYTSGTTGTPKVRAEAFFSPRPKQPARNSFHSSLGCSPSLTRGAFYFSLSFDYVGRHAFARQLHRERRRRVRAEAWYRAIAVRPLCASTHEDTSLPTQTSF
jgi:non-ribosomal peptide synthetase component F